VTIDENLLATIAYAFRGGCREAVVIDLLQRALLAARLPNSQDLIDACLAALETGSDAESAAAALVGLFRAQLD